MAKTIRIPEGFITLVKIDFKCPKCKHFYEEEDYIERLHKSKNGLIYKKCKGCGEQIGITTDILGDVCVWLKKEEKKNN